LSGLEFKGDAKNRKGLIYPQGQGQEHKIWPRGTLRPRPGLEDYISDNFTYIKYSWYSIPVDPTMKLISEPTVFKISSTDEIVLVKIFWKLVINIARPQLMTHFLHLLIFNTSQHGLVTLVVIMILKDKATFQVLFIVSLFCAWNITTVRSTVAFTYFKAKSAKCLCLLPVVLVLVLFQSWSWSCYFGLGLGS